MAMQDVSCPRVQYLSLIHILIVFLGTFFNVVVNTSTGVKMVDKLQLDVGKIFGANQFQVLKEIVLPASLPAIFAGIRVEMCIRDRPRTAPQPQGPDTAKTR